VRGVAYGSLAGVPDLECLHVLDGDRGRGIGRRLLRAVAERVRTHGQRSRRLDVLSGNPRAVDFYRRLGAVEQGTHPAAWACGVTETGMLIPDVTTVDTRQPKRSRVSRTGGGAGDPRRSSG